MTSVRGGLIMVAVSAAILFITAYSVRSHDIYHDWVNFEGKGCCNNQDCFAIADSDERTFNGVHQVKVEGEWCPVLSKHYLKKGNGANHATAHICVTGYYGGKTPCEKFICYQPKPLF